MADSIVRPPTPQAMVHRLPDRSDALPAEVTKPAQFIILLVASTDVAGKVQIAKSISSALSCPLFQGDSLHETAARAASVGVAAGAGSGALTRPTSADTDEPTRQPPASGANETRYQRMWLSKMTRTGLLFPEESRPAGGGFTGFGGPSSSSTPTSRRGSATSVASEASSLDFAAASSSSSPASSVLSSGASKYINKPPMVAHGDGESLRRANPALMVLTHPELDKWHKIGIRKAVGDYGIGVIFVPLDEEREKEEDDEEELPILKPLDPRTMTSFGSLGTFGIAHKAAHPAAHPAWDEEVALKVNVEAKVELLAEEIVNGVQDIMDS